MKSHGERMTFYARNIIDRFGHMPSMAELAKIENRAMRETMGNYRIGDPDTIRKEFLANPARVAMLAAMTEPMTARQITDATGQHKSSVQQAIARGVQGGLIRRHSVDKHYATVWERVE
jgi:hypothetical protein